MDTFFNIEEIVIVDDEYASDDFMSSLIKEASPEHLNVNVLTIEESKKFLESGDDKTRI